MALSRIAVIGANGFIGKHLVKSLLQNKDLHLNLFGRSAQSEFSNYKQIDLLDREFITSHFTGVDYVFYLASETIPANSWNNPHLEIEKNLTPFLSFMEVMAQLKVKKIGFLSSAGTVYGPSNADVSENDHKEPFSPYGIIKLTMENFLNYHYHKNGISYDIFRVSNVYGEGQDTSKGLGLINTMLEKIIKEKKITVFGDGENVRNYIYVKDVANILHRSLTFDQRNVNIVNVASNDSLSINQIIDLIKNKVTADFDIDRQPERGSDNKKISIDNKKLRSLIPSLQFTPLEQGVTCTYDHIKSNFVTKKHS